MPNLYNYFENRPYWNYFSVDGVFMKKTVKIILLGVLICSVFGFVNLIRDKQMLKNNLVRLHVVANSDTEFDQAVKIKVKDRITAYLWENMQNIDTIEQAKAYLQENLNQLEQFAYVVLAENNVSERVKISLKKEAFDKRVYDTFSLPSGVYQSLRIEIGEANGKNWWCVVFPTLCLPATGSEFRDTAVSSGFDKDLTSTLAEDKGYEIRFFLLDCLGKIENFFSFE